MAVDEARSEDHEPRRQARRLQRQARRRQEMEEIILEAAMDRLRRYGIREATMEKIAVESGLSTASLYNYFRSQDDSPKKEKTKKVLYRQIVDRVIATERECLSDALDHSKTAGRELEDIAAAYLSYGIEYPGYAQLYAHPESLVHLDDELSKRITDRVRELHEAITGVIARGVRKGELKLPHIPGRKRPSNPGHVAAFLLAAWNGLVSESQREDGMKPNESRLSELGLVGVAVVRQGIGARPSSDESAISSDTTKSAP